MKIWDPGIQFSTAQLRLQRNGRLWQVPGGSLQDDYGANPEQMADGPCNRVITLFPAKPGAPTKAGTTNHPQPPNASSLCGFGKVPVRQSGALTKDAQVPCVKQHRLCI